MYSRLHADKRLSKIRISRMEKRGWRWTRFKCAIRGHKKLILSTVLPWRRDKDPDWGLYMCNCGMKGWNCR